MATVASNELLKGLSGKFGDVLLFKTLRGKTFVSAPARKPDKRKETEAQRNTRSTFRQATQWAQTILHDPEKKAYYQQRAKALKLPNAYTAAITDYMRKPKVTKSIEGKTVHYMVQKPGFALPDVQVSVNRNDATMSTRQKNDQWSIQVSWTGDDVPAITLTITDRLRRKYPYADIPI